MSFLHELYFTPTKQSMENVSIIMSLFYDAMLNNISRNWSEIFVKNQGANKRKKHDSEFYNECVSLQKPDYTD